MTKKQVSATFQFFILSVLVLAVSVLFGKQLEPLWDRLEKSGIVKETLSPSPSPNVLSENPAATESGTTAETESLVETGVVTEVIDGDTVRLANGKTVRYIGVDTPETHHPRVKQECFGKEASSFNESLVMGKTVSLEKDVSDTDRYGRLLRYVWLDGKMVNEMLVREGYAEASAFPPDVKHQELLKLSEREARENNRGLWSSCSVGQ